MGSSLVILRCNLDEDYSLEEMSRVDGNVMFLPGCHCQAFPYFRWLLPFTDAGDACDLNFLKCQRRSKIHAYCRMTRSLPDDILFDIFLRLPDKSLVRLKVLSKHWHLSISRMCVCRSIKPVVGLFLLTYSARSTDPQFIMRSDLRVYSYVKIDGLPTQVSGSRMIGNYLPLEGEEKGPSLLCWDDCFGSFGLPFRSVAVDLLDCCNGLLLFLDLKSRLYYVCNPLTRQYVSIPRPPFLMQTFCCGALAFDPSCGSSRYKVVRMDWSPYRDVLVDIYYSFGRLWVRRELKVDQCVRNGILLCPAFL
ncbi:Unknown protein [Striga hermonthica]|uniref:F-box domain-containing protein n=1 Tax=Striga hermonthica TaxID=68872 RepID=A0A9N7N864_STRHE|nr:Unknown protein [Striga hermonthica]